MNIYAFLSLFVGAMVPVLGLLMIGHKSGVLFNKENKE